MIAMFHKKIKEERHKQGPDQTNLSEIIHPIHNPKDPNIPYSLAHAFLHPGKQSSAHSLIHSTETFIIVQGTGKIIIEGERESIQKGSVIVVPQGKQQFIHNTGTNDLEFYCIVSPPWDKNNDIPVK
jgi:mannose-6-phosphate isomerase-like protein (cupin superfamily)